MSGIWDKLTYKDVELDEERLWYGKIFISPLIPRWLVYQVHFSSSYIDRNVHNSKVQTKAI